MYICIFIYINNYTHTNIPMQIVDFGLATPSCSGVQTLVKP